ncbi:MAG: DUF4367 domain-containing protein [Oscillospiraceae bacterium]|nr:DUF4367 domain-containing protein [Oscillospiraceae bacterium]
MYDEMSTEDLMEILRADMDAPEGAESDVELILYVSEVVAQRRNANGHIGKTALEAFEDFKEHYMPEETKPASLKTSKPHRWTRILTTAAAAMLALVIFGTVSANAFGFNVWTAIARWTQETFHFVGDDAYIDEPDTEDISPVSSMRQAMLEKNDDPTVLPTWIPEGFEPTDLTVEENPRKIRYSAIWKNGDRVLRIVVHSYEEGRPEQQEKSDEVAEVYEKSGNIYYVVSNEEQMKAAWVDGSYECRVFGDVTIEELKLMIDSIEKG